MADVDLSVELQFATLRAEILGEVTRQMQELRQAQADVKKATAAGIIDSGGARKSSAATKAVLQDVKDLNRELDKTEAQSPETPLLKFGVALSEIDRRLKSTTAALRGLGNLADVRFGKIAKDIRAAADAARDLDRATRSTAFRAAAVERRTSEINDEENDPGGARLRRKLEREAAQRARADRPEDPLNRGTQIRLLQRAQAAADRAAERVADQRAKVAQLNAAFNAPAGAFPANQRPDITQAIAQLDQLKQLEQTERQASDILKRIRALQISNNSLIEGVTRVRDRFTAPGASIFARESSRDIEQFAGLFDQLEAAERAANRASDRIDAIRRSRAAAFQERGRARFTAPGAGIFAPEGPALAGGVFDPTRDRPRNLSEQLLQQERQGISEFQNRTLRDLDRLNRELSQVTPNLDRAGNAGRGSGNNIRRGIDGASDGFRRFNTLANTVTRTLVSVGSLGVVFTTFRAIAEGVRFGDEFERAEAQIAGLIASTGRVLDAQGNLARPAEAFSLALGLARDQQAKLQEDALSTTATYRELIQAFQTAIGPGLAANLDLDQIRELTVGFSQAATAIGLPQNQLAEEIRSVFSGAIDVRNTRIATVLRISNDDIRGAREAGNLFGFLQKRLEGIQTAAASLTFTLGQSFSNALDALSILGSRALDPFRQSLIEVTQLLQRGLRNQVVVDTLTGIGEALANVTRGFGNFFANLDAEEVARVFQLFDDLSSIAIGVLVPALDTLVAIVGVLTSVFGPLVAVTEEFLQTDIGGFVAQSVGAFLALRTALRLVGIQTTRTAAAVATANGIVAASTVATGRWAAVLGVISRALNPLTIGIAAAAAAFALFRGESEDPTGDIGEKITRAREEFAGVDGQGILSPFLEGTTELREGLEEVVKTLRDLRNELAVLQRQQGLGTLASAFVGTVESFRLGFDFSQADAQIAALTKQLEELRRAEFTDGGNNFDPINIPADPDIPRIEVRLLDLERQRTALIQERDRASARIASAEATRIQTLVSQELPALRDAAALARTRLNAAQTEDPADRENLEVLSLRQQLAELNREFALSAREILGEGVVASRAGDTEAAANIRAAFESLLEQRNVRQEILRLAIQTAEVEAAAAARSRQQERVRDGVRRERELITAEQSLETAARALAIARVNPATLQGQLLINQLRQEDNARRRVDAAGRLFDPATTPQERLGIQAEIVNLQADQAGLEREAGVLDARSRFGSGFFGGVDAFREQNRPGDIGARLATDSLNATTGFVSDALFTTIASAFDPNSNTSLGESLRNLSLSFGASLLRAVTDALATRAVTALLGAATGGRVPGFEGGGFVGGPNLAQSPPGTYSTDRTLAALTPGEFVLRRSTAQSIGYDVLSRLNEGRLASTDFSRLAPRLGKGIRGYAGGGAVARPTLPQGTASAPGRGQGSSGTSILPVMVADRESVRTLLKGRGFDESLRNRANLLRSAVNPRD